MSDPKNRKVPADPPAKFNTQTSDIITHEKMLWRLFRTESGHPLEWHELRHFGPVEDMRFDPHPLPKDTHVDVGVMYTAENPRTAIAEVFQATRVIDRSVDGITLASWTPVRPLQLLDLTKNWPVRNGAASAMMDDKSTTQTWARAIVDQHGDDIDGLYHQSSINNEFIVTLFSRTERKPAFPLRPNFHALLDDASTDIIVRNAMTVLGYKSVKGA